MLQLISFRNPIARQPYPSVLWLYSAARAIGMRNVPALSVLGLAVAIPLIQQVFRQIASKSRAPLRKLRQLIRRCFSALSARIRTAAREIVSAIRSLAVTGMTLAFMWTLFIGELVHQFIEALRTTAEVAGDDLGEEEGGVFYDRQPAAV